MPNVEWTKVRSVSESQKVTGKSNTELFMKLDEGRHQIRLVGKPYEVLLGWANGKKIVIPEKYIARLDSLGIKARLHYVINVFDRNDTKQGIYRTKLLEKGATIFANFKTYHDEIVDESGKNINPGGKNGPDWVINVEVPTVKGKKDKRGTKYNIVPLASTPFTAKEIEFLTRKDRVVDVEEGKEAPKGKISKIDFNKLPLNERGIVDLEKLYDPEVWGERIEKLLNDGTLSPSTGEGNSDSVDDVIDSVTGGDSLASIVSSSPEATIEDLDSMLEDSL
jgi:hypothetical protein